MPSLKDFIDALEARWFTALIALVGCSILVGCDYYKIPYLSGMPIFIVESAAVIGVFSFSIIVANIIRLPISIFSKFSFWRQNKKFRDKIREIIESSPDDEKYILSYLVSTGRMAFAAELNDRRLVPLISKGLIVVQHGVHDVNAWPHVVQSDVWEYLCTNRKLYLMKNAGQIRDPFDWRNRWG